MGSIEMLNVLEKTLKGIRRVRPDNRKVLCVPGPKTKHFKHLAAIKSKMK